MVTDLTYLKKMTDGNPTVIKEMIELFKGQIEEYTAEMRRCLEGQDYTSLANIAHKAKSSVAIMGMEELAKSLKELELKALKAEEAENYSNYIDGFISTCATAMIELKEFSQQYN